MEQKIKLNEQKLNRAIAVFVLPFSLKSNAAASLVDTLKKQEYDEFKLDDLGLENKYYGDFEVSHENMEGYYLPFTNKILFPFSLGQEGFHRFSCRINVDCEYSSENFSMPFTVLSEDVTICPFNVGFITVRVEVKENTDFSYVTEFIRQFRSLSPKKSNSSKIKIDCEGLSYSKVKDFLFKNLNSKVSDYFDKSNMEDSYFETFPFFEDDKMFVQSIFSFSDAGRIEKVEAFRAANLDGLSPKGTPAISSSNKGYIDRYIEVNGYDRWAPDTYYMVKEDHFSCVTIHTGEELRPWVSQMLGEYYYGMLLNLFHKIVLLKIANSYSALKIERDREKVEELIYVINSFTANYYFIELATESQGRDIFLHLREVFKIDEMHDDGKQTLNSLYKYQEAFADKKNSLLLLYLTLFTVISGIYGMNQVIEDLKGRIQWEKFRDYSLFEYIALFVTISGMVVSVYLTVTTFLTWRKDKDKMKRWVERTNVAASERHK
ncbi:hypothetical protein [Peribacillus sp. SCS-37]|uniref:hypothetical protein n=1 Tax=Paraperibacillus esterisolvens TaxID=3115296 RepID=UPI00390664D2